MAMPKCIDGQKCVANPRCSNGCKKTAKAVQVATWPYSVWQDEKKPAAAAMKPNVLAKARVATAFEIAEDQRRKDRESEKKMVKMTNFPPRFLPTTITDARDCAMCAHDELYRWKDAKGNPDRAIQFLRLAAQRAYRAIAMIKRDQEAAKKKAE